MTNRAKAALYLLSLSLAASTTRLGVPPANESADPRSVGRSPQATARNVAHATMGGVRVPFIENAGQLDGAVAYYAPTFGGSVFVTVSGDIVYALPKELGGESATLTERLVGAGPLAVTGMEPGATRVSYLVGSDPGRRRSGLRTFNTVSLGEAYPGVELRLSAHGNTVEKLFYVEKGADPSSIRIALSGASKLEVTANGELQAQTALGPVTFSAPVAFQERNGQRLHVPVSYAVGQDDYGFSLGAYDNSLPLVIDPTLASTFVGGGGGQSVAAIAFGPSGALYAAGTTNAADFPLGSSYKGGTNDIFVLRLDPDLTTVEAGVYLGGSLDDVSGGLGIDSLGNVFVSGKTTSTNIPVTPGAYDLSPNGGTDLFVAKLNADLTAVLAATYIGGSRDEFWCCGSTLRIDGNDDVFTVTLSNSTNYPTTLGAWDRTYNDTISTNTDDVVISKFSNNLGQLLASTYLGGGLWDVPYNSTIDADGNLYVVGRTSSGNNGYGAPFPTTPGAYHGDYADNWTSLGAYYDGFISKLNNNLQLVASTYLGTTADLDILWDVAVAPDQSVYVAGSTISNAFPGIAGHYDSTFGGGGEDGFLAHMNAGLTALIGATYLGGAGFDRTSGVALDALGNVHVGGLTNSSAFPTTGDAFQPAYHPGGTSGYDGFYARLSGDLNSLQYSTFVGGSGNDGVARPILPPQGGVYLFGSTTSSNFPTSLGAADATYGGNTDGFVMRLPTGDVALAKIASSSSVTVGSQVTYTLTATNDGPGEATGIVVVDTLPAGVSFVSATPSQGTPCTGGSTITCALGSIAEAASATVTIVVTTEAVGNVTNTAAFAASYFDAVLANNQASVSVGVLPDQDNDGVADFQDNCPAQANPGQDDADGDHIGDVCDPNNNDGPWGDLDGDGIINDLDPDDNDGPTGDLDGDGALNAADNCLLVANPGQEDTDDDGLGNACDPTPNGDTDNDGIDNLADNCPAVANPDQLDTDLDGIGNVCDPTPNGDTDNDGVDNLADNCPGVANADQANNDGDAAGDVCDPDDDNDGVPDASDAFPFNASESVDTDGDGIGNNADSDDDSDGASDATEIAAGSDPLNPASTPEVCDGLDNDLDGVADDGLPNNDSDAFGDACDSDDDNDGVPDPSDAFPLDASESVDTDGDGIGNNADPDDDNDGVPDASDAFPLNPAESIDTDGDGTGNNADLDDDNDGVPDASDAFPLNPAEAVDTDGDGIGNNADLDDDGDSDPDTTDCAALNPAVHHSAPEILGNLIDDNCNGQIDETTAPIFGGLQEPYAPPPTSFKAGRAFPLMWQYKNAQGAVVDSASANPVVRYAPAPCGAGSGAATLDVDTPGNSDLRYDPLTRTWKVVWNTTGLPAGCYVLVITSPMAQSSLLIPFQFR